jgi:uncharacterized protein (TIGR01244 family)
MEIRPLTDTYAVSPQIAPADARAIAEAGYTMVICNRPDAENPPEQHMDAVRAAVEAAGMTFVANPFSGPTMGMDNVTAQAEAVARATGPVLAYCASGNRSSIMWALSQAGTQSTDSMIAAAARYGYQLEGLRNQIDTLATQKA